MSMERPDLRPTVALLHPLWVGALAVLVLNDHVLKGSGLLPGSVTGKLSDVAGLVVAPTLLAVMLRVRRRGGIAACHAAVGLVFSAIQLSPTAAAAWSGLMGLLGFPWQIFSDPLDLLALPALVLSWRVLIPAARRPARGLALGSLRTALACVGLLACLGTSPPERPVLFSDFFGEVYLHNGTKVDRVVRIRLLRLDVLLDCDAIEADPGLLLQPALFGDAQTWSIPPTANVPVSPDDSFDEPVDPQQCRAALLESDEAPTRIVFWLPGDLEDRSIEGNTFDPKDHTPGAILIEERKSEISYDDRDEGLLFVPSPPTDPGDPSCAFPPDAARLEWSTPLPLGNFELAAVDLGLDGCFALDLTDAKRWYLCVPQELFPFAPGDTIEIGALPDVGPAIAGTYDGVFVQRLDPATLEPAADEAALFASRGTGMPRLWETGAMFQAGCPVVTEEVCATAGANGELELLVEGEVQVLTAGEVLTSLPAGGASLSYALMHAQDRVLLDPACALGPDSLGPDLEIVGSRIVP